MSDWSRNAAHRINEQDSQERIKNETALAQEKLLEHNGPPLWQELRQSLMQMCNDFNSEDGMKGALLHQGTSEELRIEYPKRNRSITISFDSKRHRLMVSGAIALSYTLRGEVGTQEISFIDGHGMSAPIHLIGRKVLSELLGI